MLVEHMCKREREATPLPFALYLVSRVCERYQCTRVAVLWCQSGSVYYQLHPITDVWTVCRDATLYDGPYPIIAHPPCGGWGAYKSRSRQRRHHGILAMGMVHRWGGVVEQPVGSELFRLYGRGGVIEYVCQGDYGHRAKKATALYWGT